MRFSFFMLMLAAVCTITLNVGCDTPPSTDGTNTAADHGHSHDGDDHGHGHDGEGEDEEAHDEHEGHDHSAAAEEMGPNKGHIIYLKPEKYVSEWRHYKGNSVIRVYVLDKDKKSTAVDAKVSIVPEAGKTRDPFVLEPEDAEDGKTAVYMLDDDKLSVAMNLGVTLKIEIDGETYEGKIPPHKPHHH